MWDYSFFSPFFPFFSVLSFYFYFFLFFSFLLSFSSFSYAVEWECTSGSFKCMQSLSVSSSTIRAVLIWPDTICRLDKGRDEQMNECMNLSPLLIRPGQHSDGAAVFRDSSPIQCRPSVQIPGSRQVSPPHCLTSAPLMTVMELTGCQPTLIDYAWSH